MPDFRTIHTAAGRAAVAAEASSVHIVRAPMAEGYPYGGKLVGV